MKSRIQIYDRVWNTKYNKLTKYFNKNGHCDIRRTTDNVEVGSLASWVDEQHKCQRNNQLPPYRKRKLDKINFFWSGCEGEKKTTNHHQNQDTFNRVKKNSKVNDVSR